MPDFGLVRGGVGLARFVWDRSITPRTQAVLFLGERRLQLACTAGTCYEVPAFRGVELRVLSRF